MVMGPIFVDTDAPDPDTLSQEFLLIFFLSRYCNPMALHPSWDELRAAVRNGVNRKGAVRPRG